MRADVVERWRDEGVLGGVPVSRLEPGRPELDRPDHRRRDRDQYRRRPRRLAEALEEVLA